MHIYQITRQNARVEHGLAPHAQGELLKKSLIIKGEY